MSTMSQPFRVSATGEVTLLPVGGVPHTGAARLVASLPHSAKSPSFRHNPGVPADVWVGDRKTDILGATVPHNCANHLPGGVE